MRKLGDHKPKNMTREDRAEQIKKRLEYTREHGSPKQVVGRTYKRERMTQEEIDEIAVNNLIDTPVYLKDKDLSGLDMQGYIFHNAVFKNCDLSGANMKNCNLTHALIDHCIMEDTEIEGTAFFNAWMFHNEGLRVHSVDLVGQVGVKTARFNYIQDIDSVQGLGFVGTLAEFIEQADQLADEYHDPYIPLVAEFFDSRRKMTASIK